MYDVGGKVRVNIGPGRTCRGLILCTGRAENGDPTFDVLLQSPDPTLTAVKATPTSISAGSKEKESGDACSGRELTGLPASDLSSLQPFELEENMEDRQAAESSCNCGTPAAQGEKVRRRAEVLKDRGNTLFKLGDTDAAAEWFTRVLRTLEQTPVVGATVLVRMASQPGVASRYRSGIISDANDSVDSPQRPVSFDVLYDGIDKAEGKGDGGGEDEEDEEDGVPADRVQGFPTSPSIWCAARLNLARCSFRRGEHKEVVEACTLVLSLARLTMAEKERARDDRVKLRAHCLTALRMRGGSHLAQNHVALARKDARTMMRSSGDSEESRAQAARFEAEVERKAKALLKANRKLAKDVTRWVDVSMAKHEEAAQRNREENDEALPPPPSGEEMGEGVGRDFHDDGGVEESKGGGKSSGYGGVMSWLGGWTR